MNQSQNLQSKNRLITSEIPIRQQTGTVAMKDFEVSCAADFFRTVQENIVRRLELYEGTLFGEDQWKRDGGGGGITKVIQDGLVFEKAGVNFSWVHGDMGEDFAGQMPGNGTSFQATGISLVLHPRNPKIPTVHANFRYIAKGNRSWYGGGADLTPYYPKTVDIINFHKTWKAVCDRHRPTVDYQKYKKWCDEYFFLPHRQEARGVGGIFFDYLDATPDSWAFVQEAAESFLSSYEPILVERLKETFTAGEKEFQEYRRGRYVEFNLIYDRGTLFGLKTGGRTESILMSLPKIARWWYDHHLALGSPEANLLAYLQPRDWASLPEDAII